MIDVEVAVILPAYNEEQTIGETIAAFHAALPHAAIVVVNNNSQDRTAEIAWQTLRCLGALGAVFDEPRQGKGNAVRRAFAEVNAEHYVLADADLTYPAEQVEHLLEPVRTGRADMVVGDRLSAGTYRRENKRRFHVLGNALVGTLVNLLFRARLCDIMSGYRAFSRRFVKNYPILVEGFQLETDMTLHALDKRFRVVEIPVDYRDRPPGSTSKLSTLRDGMRVLFTIAQILRYYRPLMFFGGIGVVLALLGLLAAVPVFDDWLRYRYIHHVPLAILASALEMVAVISFGIGLILDAINHQQKMAFERALLRPPGRD
jgi:glycosyltransferase involved in cell wall biosynthesis